MATQQEHEDRLAEEFWHTLKAEAASHGRRWSDDNVADLQGLARVAARTVLEAPAFSHATLIASALAGFRNLVTYAVEEAWRRAPEGYPPDVLGEQTLHAARLRLCPCPPIC